jgi:hypothetical protein
MACATFGAAVFIVVSTFLRPLVGRYEWSQTTTIMVDMAVAATVLAVTFALSRQFLFRILGLFGPAVVLYVVASHAYWAAGLQSAMVMQAEAKPAAAATGARPQGNVYHVMLDMYQSELFPIVLEQQRDLDFSGFRFYRRYNSNYSRTEISIPAILAGRFYASGESFPAFEAQAHRQGYWAALRDNNVDVWLYPYIGLHRSFCPEFPLGCTYAEDLYLESKQFFSIATIVDFWFLRLLPNSVALRIYRGSYSFTRPHLGIEAPPAFSLTASVLNFAGSTAWAGLVERSATKKLTLAPADVALYTSRRQLMSVALFEQFLRDEPRRPANGQYTYIHVMIPHPPWTLDEKCNGLPPSTEDIDAGPGSPLGTTSCATRLAARLVDRLKELGRFDNSLIMIQSDHGDTFSFGVDTYASRFDRKKTMDDVAARTLPALFITRPQLEHYWTHTSDWPPSMVETASSALLAVKFPGVTQFVASDEPAAAIDIAPTVLRHFGLPTHAWPGIPLHPGSERARDARPIEFFVTTRGARKIKRYVFTDGTWVPTTDIEPLHP